MRSWPFFAKGNKVGWLVEAETEFLAAVAEVVTFYTNRWRPGFTACRECLTLFYGRQLLCEKCRASEGGWRLEKEEFLNLLRVHRFRYRALTDEIARIADLAKQARGPEDLRLAKAAYLAACERLGLPTGWAGGDLAASKRQRLLPLREQGRATVRLCVEETRAGAEEMARGASGICV